MSFQVDTAQLREHLERMRQSRARLDALSAAVLEARELSDGELGLSLGRIGLNLAQQKEEAAQVYAVLQNLEENVEQLRREESETLDELTEWTKRLFL